uniref:Palmdelphin n=1 Tax=Monopterus albus TaxID=43700 RepID=A0A3Q3K428_MONAL
MLIPLLLFSLSKDLHLSLFFIPATFAIEISVVQNKRTGKAQVVSTVPITAETIPERGQKVYDDGRKSVHALHSEGSKMHSGAAEGLTSTEVEELLRMATDQNMSAEVQYHRPVYSVPYTGSNNHSPSLTSYESDPNYTIETPDHFNRPSPFCAESITPVNIVDTLPDELESQPVTMIFMGYENAEEEEDIQAELVIIANSDDDDGYEAKYVNEESDAEECLSYHPEGYKTTNRKQCSCQMCVIVSLCWCMCTVK